MRAIWKGAVSFGLVNVPVRLYSATENHDVQFRQVHREDGGRIRYQRICSIDGAEVAYEDIAKGFETDDGRMVVLTDEDLAQLPISTSKEIAVDKFVPVDQIDPILLDKVYYLEPEKAALKPYLLLREALSQTDRMALVTVALRTRTTVAVLRVRDEAIVLQTMLWPDEVRPADFEVFDAKAETPKKAELAMAQMLVESMSGDYDPDEYEDEYEAAVHAVVDAKLEGGEVTAPPEPDEDDDDVVDLLVALRRSVERARKSRDQDTGTSGGRAGAEAGRSSAAKAPAEKAAAGRTGGSKTPASRSTAKKTAKKAG